MADRGVDAEIVLVNHFVPGKLSSAYRELAAKLRTPRGILAGLERDFPGSRPDADYAYRLAASYSAGYGLWAELFGSREDLSALDGYIAIDSYHAGLDADHTASDVALGPLVALALSARERHRVLWYGHTDVPTPQTGPGAYASTTQVAAELLRLVGEEAGGFHVGAFDLETDPAREHGRALTVWGPAWLADAVLELIMLRGGDAPASSPGTVPRPSAFAQVGLVALTIAAAELEAKVAEIPPGSNGGPRIAEYFAGCERAGKPLRLTSGEWCAAGASWSAFQAVRRAGGRVPHRWRASVVELWRDACSSEFGAARSAADVRAGRYRPRAGDLWIGVRGGAAAGRGASPDAAFVPTAGKGHVGRFMAMPDQNGLFATLDANHGTAWGIAKRNLSDPEFVGVIAHGDSARPPTDAELASLDELLRAG
jgi:hypothetical protein